MRALYTLCVVMLNYLLCPAQHVDSTFISPTPIDSLAITTLEPPKDLFFSKPTYRISIGAGFDFIERLKPSHIYGDLIIDIPQLIKGKKVTSGFHGGVYQLRHVTIDSLVPDEVFLTSSTPLVQSSAHHDSTVVRLSKAKGAQRIQLDNLHFFASLYRPWHLTYGVTGSSGLYHVVRLGSVRSKIIIEENFHRTTNDTVFVTTNPDFPLLPRNSKTQEVRNYWEVGVGQMIRHEFDDLALQVSGLLLAFPTTWDFGYIISFNAVGSRSGLIIGAEIRTEPLLQDQLYNVFLAKTIKVKDVAKLITSY